MRILTTSFLYLLLFTSFSNATRQIPDRVHLDSKLYHISEFSNYLMDSYFKKFPGKIPRSGVRSTALRRGYVATYELKENILVLKDIQIKIQVKNKREPFEMKSVLEDIVPKGETLKIDWFTGILVLPHGNQKNLYPNYSNYILLEIKEGKLTDRRDFTNAQWKLFKRIQHFEYKKTENYKKHFNGDLQSKRAHQIDDLIRYNITLYTKEFLDNPDNLKVHNKEKIETKKKD